jgi:bacteriorhodopsin
MFVRNERKDWKREFEKVKAGPNVKLTILTSSALRVLVAGLGCLCGSVSVFTTKTSGVQHQIQDALVVFVDQLNLVHFLFDLFSLHSFASASCLW